MFTKPQLTSEWIDPHAINIIEALQRRNFPSYLVGGCVRDLLVGIPPKDFDIVTMAKPEEVQKIIRPSHIIGRRFRLVLVRRSGQQFEISTFRSLNFQSEEDPDAIDENIYGEPKEDALRRDFTINGLFYDPINQDIIDHTNGLNDIKAKVIRMIGDPLKRIQEDPIRILRALRLSHKISFSIEQNLQQAIAKNPELLKNAILPRVREEILKIFRLKKCEAALWEAYDLGLLKILTPTFHEKLSDNQWATEFFHFFNQGKEAIKNLTDPYELFSVFMYSFLAAGNEEWQCHLSTKIDDKTMEFMRTELGMHRVETEMFTQALNLLKQLIKSPLPEGLRARHRAHLLNNRSLYLSLTLAQAYQYLSQFECQHWVNDQPTEARPQRRQKAYRRRPKVKL